ncbi:hypothetical protein [Christiangramia sp.]|uniref:hypothetical protein n=1 Tax=Christiangramia sp. TaxID=1931228 RepID=UPI0026145AE6|nr:hypothetical protein [Christiangramia sp.]
MKISNFLSQRKEEPIKKNKKIKRKIRNIGFYFSENSKKGYTVADFENLIRNGNIEITTRKEVVFVKIARRTEQTIKHVKENLPDIS